MKIVNIKIGKTHMKRKKYKTHKTLQITKTTLKTRILSIDPGGCYHVNIDT